MLIVDMARLSKDQITQAAEILTQSIPIGWPTLEDALLEIHERLVPENTMLAAVEGDLVLGWGGILAPSYDGNVFELHPLAVSHDARGKGVGRAIVLALEDAARQKGGLTIYLGADDEKPGGETSLANVDLYDDLPHRLASFNPGTHQSGFYMKLGYKIIGVMPDANGYGKPDIIWGKRL
ncbi:MAG: GNAT family N-acetyltransferase [Selenomonadales bacterium]|nr:GNAT family N-acetyltransferase [Selenomonadales bacterium]